MINLGKEAYHDEEGDLEVDRTARSEHRHGNSHSPRSNKLSGLLNKEKSSPLGEDFILLNVGQVELIILVEHLLDSVYLQKLRSTSGSDVST